MIVVVGKFRRGAETSAGRGTQPRALVIDDEKLFRAVVERMLEESPARFGVETCSVADGPEVMARADFDIVVCPLSEGRLRGDEVAASLLAAGRPAKVVLFVEPDSGHVLQALRSGAAGLFSREDDYDDFVEGVQLVLGGHMALGPRVAQLALGLLQAPREAEVFAIGKVDRDVLGQYLSGTSISDIAAGAGVSTKTVRNRLSRIYKKLDVEVWRRAGPSGRGPGPGGRPG